MPDTPGSMAVSGDTPPGESGVGVGIHTALSRAPIALQRAPASRISSCRAARPQSQAASRTMAAKKCENGFLVLVLVLVLVTRSFGLESVFGAIAVGWEACRGSLAACVEPIVQRWWGGVLVMLTSGRDGGGGRRGGTTCRCGADDDG